VGASVKSFNWIDELESGLRAELLACATEKSLPKDTMIQHGGEVATHVHQVVSGRVRQFILDENGNEILLHIHGEGDVLGDSLGLGELTYPLWLSSQGPVVLRSWSAECIARLRARHDAIDAAVDARTAQRFRVAITLLTDLATLDAFGRVAGRLCHVAQFAQIRGEPTLDNCQEDLAMMANVSRQTVNKVIAELTAKNIVRGGYGSIRIDDFDALKRYRDSHRRRP
jgi:CRP/FNR family cyclic AMP-dependent transcriptional regulator